MKMKARYLTAALLAACACGTGRAQMPMNQPTPQPGAAAPNSFDASGSAAKGTSDDPLRRGEQANPQLFGMEIPVLDPSTDTVAYNGGYFDVGNNAVVRARFEKYLQQIPDDSKESRRYRDLLNKILKLTQRSGNDPKYSIGGRTLIEIGHGLYEANDYPGDGGQSGMLASSMVSALNVQRSNLLRDKQNEELAEEMERLVVRANQKHNASNSRKDSINNSQATQGKNGRRGGSASDMNVERIAHDMKTVAKNETTIAANTTANQTSLGLAKANYQTVLVSLLLSRRFDHAVIGARVYRFIFKDGDTRLKMDKKSKSYEVITGVAGMPPTIDTIDSLASNARRDVDQSIQAVHSMLAQNKLGEATQHLIEAVAIGEYMQSVATFPTEARQRIARYWTLRKRAMTALNSRDYATVEEVAAKMKEMDVDFDDSMLLSYTTGKKMQSDLAIRNAAKALQAGNEEDFNRYIQEAGMIWPRNPKLKEASEKLAEVDAGDPVKVEFRNLYEAKEYRRIAREKDRFKIVAMDPELAKQYEEVIMLVGSMDGMLENIRALAEQDAAMGACMAYEKMVEWQAQNEAYAEDAAMREARRDFELKAHDFVQALRDARACEERREFGSALSCYYRARCKYPYSNIADKGIKRVTEVIMQATYN